LEGGLVSEFHKAVYEINSYNEVRDIDKKYTGN
jgi:hypothetical protein